jgi:hypothetical protein
MEGTRRLESTSVGLHTRETSIQKQCERCADTAWGRYRLLPQLTSCQDLQQIEENHKVPKEKTQWDLEKLYTQKQTVQDTLEGKLGAIKCDSGNDEVQWNNIKECVLDTLSDLVGKVEKRARKPWITQKMISKMDERRKCKNVNTGEGRKNYRRLRNELKRATDNAKKEYIENICNEIMEF